MKETVPSIDPYQRAYHRVFQMLAYSFIISQVRYSPFDHSHFALEFIRQYLNQKMTKENRSVNFVSLFLGNEVRNYIRLLNILLKSIFPEVEASHSKLAKRA